MLGVGCRSLTKEFSGALVAEIGWFSTLERDNLCQECVYGCGVCEKDRIRICMNKSGPRTREDQEFWCYW